MVNPALSQNLEGSKILNRFSMSALHTGIFLRALANTNSGDSIPQAFRNFISEEGLLKKLEDDKAGD